MFLCVTHLFVKPFLYRSEADNVLLQYFILHELFLHSVHQQHTAGLQTTLNMTVS